jgi:hypothetical protein
MTGDGRNSTTPEAFACVPGTADTVTPAVVTRVLRRPGTRTELENAGAAMVFENAADSLNHIDDTPIARLATITTF